MVFCLDAEASAIAGNVYTLDRPFAPKFEGIWICIISKPANHAALSDSNSADREAFHVAALTSGRLKVYRNMRIL